MTYPSITGYEILGEIGEGGMGAVYLARQLSLTRLVAIKILPAHLAGNESYVMRFRQEAKAAAKIRHANIVQIFDAGEDHGLFYFVMEYINGETAGARVRRKGHLDEESALLIGESVGVALEYAWQQSLLVHRDVKPDNILIDGDGTVKVADLGLAKLLDSSSGGITMAASMIGSPHYCAPEQARGETTVDCRADIYALGATLYHLVTGQPPFHDTSGVSAMVKNITDFLPDPLDINASISEPFAWLVEKMMAKNKNDRQKNWHQVLDDMALVLRGAMPASPSLPEGASTIRRGELRKRNGPVTGVTKAPVPAESAAPPMPPAEPSRSSSAFFRVFLVVAAVFTIALYIVWFKTEKVRINAPRAPGLEKPAPIVKFIRQTIMK